MKILIFTTYKDSWPYIPEFMTEMAQKGHLVDVLDIFNAELIHQGTPATVKKYLPLFFLESIPGVKLFFKFIRSILFFKSILKIISEYDVINIHYVSVFYTLFIRSIRRRAKKLIASIWGSDFYRINDSAHQKLKKIYKLADAITFINPQTKADFLKYYNNYSDKCYLVRFGLGSLNAIAKIEHEEERKTSKIALGIPTDSFVITCGYNGSPAQQHVKIIESLTSIKNFLPKNLIILLPMTYGSTGQYSSLVKNTIEKIGIKYKIFSSRLSNDDVARIRLTTDIALNFQITDQLSASIQEHLYTGSVVITGNWLPYKIFNELGIYFFRITLEELPAIISECIDDFPVVSDKCLNNKLLISNFSSWKNNVNSWVNLYNTI